MRPETSEASKEVSNEVKRKNERRKKLSNVSKKFRFYTDIFLETNDIKRYRSRRIEDGGSTVKTRLRSTYIREVYSII